MITKRKGTQMSFRKVLFLVASLVLTFGSSMAFAADAAATGDSGWHALAAAIAISVAAFGGALGQGKTAAAALEGIARNPAAQGKIFVPMIICLALIESLVLYAFVIAFAVKG
jgi:F-type H+-transporting ATPase subunit c